MSKTSLYRYLDTVGDGTGTKNAVGDYSSTVTEFKICPASNERMDIARIMVCVVDAGSLDSGAYGNGLALTNGIEIKMKDSDDDSTIVDVTDGLPIKMNSDWARLAGVDVSPMGWGAGDEQLVVRFTFQKSGVSMKLNGENNEYLAVILNDDLTGLNGHYFMAQGRYWF